MRFAAEIWLLCLPALPLVAVLLRWGDRRARRRLNLLLGERAEEHIEQDNPRLRQWHRFLLLAGLFWLIVALARPQWGANEVVVRQRGTDIVIALDISNSMLAEDVPPSRMERAKAELTGFLGGLERGRIGLVLFAGSAFIQCPLTLDYGTAQIFLRMAGPDMISEQGTAIASALTTARQLLSGTGRRPGEQVFQAIILVTDGEDLEGDWEQQVEQCRQEGVVVMPVAVGQETGGLIPVLDQEGRPAGFLKDDEGNVVMTRLDMVALQKIAAMSGSSLLRIGGGAAAADHLRTALRRLGERDLEDRRISAFQERFIWPLGLAFLCLLVRALLSSRRSRQAGRNGRSVAAALALAWLLVADSPAALGADLGLRPPGAAETDAGRRYYAQGDHEQARQAFQAAQAENPDDARLSLALGETLFQLQRYEEAATEFRRALNQSSDVDLQAESLYNAGTCLLEQGDAEQASQMLKQSLRLQPDRLETLFNLEVALQRLQQAQDQSQQSPSDENSEQDPADENSPQEDRSDAPPDSTESQTPPPDEPQDGEQPEPSSGEEDSAEEPEPSAETEPESSPAEDESAGQDAQESAEEAQEEPISEEEMSEQRALSILRALDRDEEELKRSVQKRLQGGAARSGKRW